MKKPLLVHDIDSALNLQNYNRFDKPETEKKIIGVIKDKNSTEEIHFTNNPQNVLNVGRVFKQRNREMLADFLHHTNKKIDSIPAKLRVDFNKDFKGNGTKAFRGLFIPWIIQTEYYGNSETFF